MNTSLLSTFAATLFALLNPLGVLPVFISYAAILKSFGISLDSFRIAGA